jgi:hypothetical protein
VKITVDNKGGFFPFGSLVEIIKVMDEWNVVVRSSESDNTVMLRAGEFIEDRSAY